MRDHEIELIAALVEGRLEDETEARALVDSSPEHREEYEAQKLAYQALSDAGTVSLTDHERAGLRRDVWSELRAGSAPTRPRAPWYYRWVPVAAGLFLIVGLVAVLGQVGGGDDAASEETMRLADAPTEETTSTAEATDELDAGDDGGEAAPGAGAQTETTVATEEADAGNESDAATTLYTDEAELVRQGDFSGGDLESYESEETRAADVARCLETLGIGDYRVVASLPHATDDPTGTTPADTTTTAPPTDPSPLLVAIPDTVDPASAPVAFVDIDGCDLVYLHQ